MARALGDMPFRELLPESIRGDEKIRSAADALDAELRAVDASLSQVLILARLAELPETVLDLLGWQFHVEGWEAARSAEQKRELVRRAIPTHRRKGTRWALDQVLGALGLGARIEEWFEYGGAPYTFRVVVEVTDRGLDEASYVEILDVIVAYKNVRSWLESLVIYLTGRGQVPVIACALLCGEEATVYPWSPPLLEERGPLALAAGIQAVETTTLYPAEA